MKDTDVIDATLFGDTLTLLYMGIGLVLVVIFRCCIVRRTGYPAWYGIVWSVPIIGWFFKLWLARAKWPGTTSKSPRKRAPAKKRRSTSSRRRTAA